MCGKSPLSLSTSVVLLGRRGLFFTSEKKTSINMTFWVVKVSQRLTVFPFIRGISSSRDTFKCLTFGWDCLCKLVNVEHKVAVMLWSLHGMLCHHCGAELFSLPFDWWSWGFFLMCFGHNRLKLSSTKMTQGRKVPEFLTKHWPKIVQCLKTPEGEHLFHKRGIWPKK